MFTRSLVGRASGLTVRPVTHGKFTNGLTNMHKTWNRGCTSMRKMAEMEDQVLDVLRKVRQQQGDRDVVSMGLVKNLKIFQGRISFELQSNDARVRKACEDALRAAQFPWMTQDPVIPLVSPHTKNTTKVAQGRGLENVGRIVAVSSCKGGVGKSTVAVNLACAMAEKLGGGGRVGILDTDVYGPSLPTMMVPENEDWAVTQSEDKKMINPVTFHGIKCMSYGFVAPGTGGRGGRAKRSPGAAVLRGPIVSNVVTQLAHMTEWGKLDYLVLDMPPGTGDIQITLGQQIKIDGAVIVTTPQLLSFVDVVKGLEMFDKLKVPTVAVVENMSWFDGDDGKRYQPFGKGHRERLMNEYGIQNAFSLPILETTSRSGDIGTPFFLQHNSSEAANVYRELATGVEQELNNLSGSAQGGATTALTSSIRYDENAREIRARFFSNEEAVEYRIPPIELRKRLRKVDDMIGKSADDLDPNLYPVKIQPMGNYAISIVWSDGHDGSIYPFEDIRKACKEFQQ